MNETGMHVGVVIADEKEFSPFCALSGAAPVELCGNKIISTVCGDAKVTVVLCGIGKVNAASAAALLIHRCGCNIILNAGLSGGVKINRSTLVVSKRFVEHDFDLTPIGYPLAKKPNEDRFIKADPQLLEKAISTLSDLNLIPATLGSGDSFIADKLTAGKFISEFDEDACDMESAAIASVCKKCEIPFLAFRKISDSADECAADDYNEMNDREEIVLAEMIFRFIKEI